MNLPCLKITDQGVEISLFVLPRASRNQVVGLHGNELKVKLAAPPVDGAANQECRIYLAKLCGFPKSRVTLVSGETSRHKRLFVEGADVKEISDVLKMLLRT